MLIVDLIIRLRGSLLAIIIPAPPSTIPPLADPSVYMTKLGLESVMNFSAAACLLASLSSLPVVPLRVGFTVRLCDVDHGSRM